MVLDLIFHPETAIMTQKVSTGESFHILSPIIYIDKVEYWPLRVTSKTSTGKRSSMELGLSNIKEV
jgi:hypothetical protein